MRAAATLPDEDLRLDPVVDGLLRVAAVEFPDLGYLSPSGWLDIAVRHGPVRAIRVEISAGDMLQQQCIAVAAERLDGAPVAVRIRASAWSEEQRLPFQPDADLELAPPEGAVIRATADQRAWAELRFSRPVIVAGLRLRNAPLEMAHRARGLKVAVRTRWRAHVVYDGGARLRAWRTKVAAANAEVGADAEAVGLLKVIDLTVRGEYARAHTALVAHVADDHVRRRFRAAIGEAVLQARGLEWTVHGPRRPFRSWSEEERLDYVRESALVVQALGTLTPNVCLGFGSVLAVVRDKALIPHDDDLDVIVGFEPGEAATLADALRLVEEHMRGLGFEVSGGFAAHRHVRRARGKPVDVFVGIFEGDSISWYPGPRRGLTRSMVFPPGSADLLGLPCSIPAQPEAYLECLYGTGWRVPDPYFSHVWDVTAYADIAGTPARAPRP